MRTSFQRFGLPALSVFVALAALASGWHRMSAEAQTGPGRQDKTQQGSTEQPAGLKVGNIEIESASYGDREIQASCLKYQARHGRRSSQCKFTCDAKQAVRVACLAPLKQQLVFSKADGTPAKPDAANPLKVGNDIVDVSLANGVMCRFVVNVDLCLRIDPAPDAKLKTFEIKFRCLDAKVANNSTEAHTIVAAEGATVTVHCPQPK